MPQPQLRRSRHRIGSEDNVSLSSHHGRIPPIVIREAGTAVQKEDETTSTGAKRLQSRRADPGARGGAAEGCGQLREPARPECLLVGPLGHIRHQSVGAHARGR